MKIIDALSNFNSKQILIPVILISIVIRLLLVSLNPLVFDETMYSIMILDQIEHPTIIPTFLGYPVFWKPPLFYWMYAGFVAVLKQLPIGIEMIFRLPSHIFGIVSIVLTHLLLKQLKIDKRVAIFTLIAYSFNFLVIDTANRLLADTLLNTFILASIFVYINSKWDSKRFILAGMLAFAAFYIKLIVAFVIPVLAMAYFYFSDKKILTDKLFLLSLLSVPLALGTYYYIYADTLSSPEFSDAAYKEIFLRADLTVQNGLERVSSTGNFFTYSNFWLVLSFLGFVKFRKDNKFLTVWFVIIIIPLFSAANLHWYFLPLLLPLSYFAVSALIHNENKEVTIDKFFLIVFSLILVIGFVIGLTNSYVLGKILEPQKQAGDFLAFKENVYIMGSSPQTIVAYKVLTERMAGRDIDFGWIILPMGGNNTINNIELEEMAENYYSSPENKKVINGSFARVYWDASIFRKETNITKAEWIAVTSLGTEMALPSKKPLQTFGENANTTVKIYKME